MLLAIDTATRMPSLALYDGERVLAEETWRSANNHTVELAPALVRALERQRVSPSELRGIAVALGPGSFTGLLIGLGVAKGLALTLVTEDDRELLEKIEKQMGGKISEKKLAGLEERAKPAPRPRVREETRESPPTQEHQAPEADQQQSKPRSLHGGWHRKRTGRRRR